ncbi:MAG: hypothetical protein LBU18_05740 [Treponema sp.]|nr:hypothetical protein [Treponema sp.]
MDRRCSLIGAGLLGFLANLSLVLCPVFSEEAGYFPDPDYYLDYGLSPETGLSGDAAMNMKVLLEVSPEIPEVHAEWLIRILVDYPNPQDVSIQIPELPPSLVLDRLRTAVRFVSSDEETGPAAEEKWTVVDLFFIPVLNGPLSLAPFEVRVPGGFGRSLPVSATVRGGEDEAGSIMAAWESAPAFLVAGHSAETGLRLITRLIENPQSLSYRPEAPSNAIIEPAGAEKTGPEEFVLRFRIIPLEGNSIIIPPGILKYEEFSAAVPGREFAVLPSAGRQADSAGASAQGPVSSRDQGAGEDPAGTRLSSAPAFPDAAAVFPPFRKGYEQALKEGRLYWEQGLYAEALAALRLNERELAAGPALALPRRAAEKALGIEFTEDERWRPRYLLPGLSAVISFIFFALLIKGRRKIFTVTLGSIRGYTFIAALFCITLGTSVYGFFSGSVRQAKPDKSRTGILREAGLFRVPEKESLMDPVLQEGEPVRIRSLTDAWVYVESFEGKAGWVPLERIIFY